MNVYFWEKKIREFVLSTWGEKAMESLPERAARIVEEAIELGQCHEVPKEVMQNILDRVYSRPKGDSPEEAGDVMFTLLAYTEAAGLDIEPMLANRLKRVSAISVEELRERHKQKRAAGTLLYED